MITSFRSPHEFLSNFHKVPVEVCALNGIYGRSAEHVFQAAKARDFHQRVWVLEALEPGEAKARGRQVRKIDDWDRVKRRVMLEVVLAKFTQHPDLADKLAATSLHVLVEGNNWGDTYWGATFHPSGQGQDLPGWLDDKSTVWHGENWLGRILMSVREVFRD